MDLTPEYIEMCSKAQEIQDTRKVFLEDYKSGDYFIDKNNKHEVDVYHINNDVIYMYDDDDEFIFCPKQDQLQEMVINIFIDSDNKYPTYKMLENFYDHEGELSVSNEDRSLEQAWLAFVMKEKYSKQWNFETKEWEVVK